MKPNVVLGANQISDAAIELYLKPAEGTIWVVDAPACTTLDHAPAEKRCARSVVIDMDTGNSCWREEYVVIAVYVDWTDLHGSHQEGGYLLEVKERNGQVFIELEYAHKNGAFPLAAVVGRDTLVLPVGDAVYVHGTPTKEGMLQVPCGAICRALVSMDTHELEESACGETLEQKLVRLKQENDAVRQQLAAAVQQHGARAAVGQSLVGLVDVLVSQRNHYSKELADADSAAAQMVLLLNRIANEGCSLPHLEAPYARTADEWCGQSDTEWCVTGDVFEEWVAKLRKQALHSNQLRQAQEWAATAMRERDCLAARLNRIAREGVSLPTTNSVRTVADWLNDSDTPNCVSEQVMQQWLASMTPTSEYEAVKKQLAGCRGTVRSICGDVLATVVNVVALRKVARASLPLSPEAMRRKDRAMRRSKEKLLDLAEYLDLSTVTDVVREAVEELRAE